MPYAKRRRTGKSRKMNINSLRFKLTNPTYSPRTHGRMWDETNRVWKAVERSPSTLQAYGYSRASASSEQLAKRDADRYVGKGLYMGGRGGYWGKKIGGLFGKKYEDFGDKAGDIGSSLIRRFVPGGSTAMDAAVLAGRYLGQGEYTAANSLVSGGGDPVPTFTPSPDGVTVHISHREYLGDVFAPDVGDVFQNTAFSINPGLEKTFPWLSQIAQNYDEYTIHQLMFSFRSTVADFASGTGQVGGVIMGTIYNSASQPFTDKATMMQYDGAMSCKTSESMVHGVECDPSKLSGPVGRFVRANPVLVGQDINQYDSGLFNIAVTETPAGYANQSMGELWVSYTVELRKPKFFTNRGLGISRDLILTKASYTSGFPFGDINNSGTTFFGQQNNIGCTFEERANPGPGIIPPTAISVTGGGAPTAEYWGKINFPANYAGNITVRLFGFIGIVPAGYAFNVHATGSIKPIDDMMNGVDLFTESSTTAYDTTSGIYNQVIHIRVETAANGVDNTLWMETIAGPAAATRNFMIDITEYNTGLNYRQDGTNDQPIVVNRAGIVVL